MLPSSLQVSIVTYRPDLPLLERTLDALAIAIETAQTADVLKTVHLALIDNSADRGTAERVIELGRARFGDSRVHVMYLHGHANIGFGAAHNLVLHGTGADYHLVLNPDAEPAADALVNAIRWLDTHPEVGAL
ncbi:MAG: glycosyltransferase family 2 protein, partial [Betaproteobacteria bacterium]